MFPLVQCCLVFAAEATNTTDRMVGYAEIGSMDTYFYILKTKELVGLAMVPMNSRGSDMVL